MHSTSTEQAPEEQSGSEAEVPLVCSPNKLAPAPTSSKETCRSFIEKDSVGWERPVRAPDSSSTG
jgi:hypothetical protein